MALAIKSLQKKMEDKLMTELEQKLQEIEAELKLKQVLELAKEELNAVIANEKAQIGKKAEADFNCFQLNPECSLVVRMNFYSISEGISTTDVKYCTLQQLTINN